MFDPYVYPESQTLINKFNIRDPDKLQDLEAAFFRIKITDPLTMFEFVCDSSRTIIHLLIAGIFEKYPDINFIVPHAGEVIPYLSGRIKLYETTLLPSSFVHALKGVDYYLKRLYYDTAMLGSSAQLHCLTDYIPCEQIVLGTDSPYAIAEGHVRFA